MLLLQHGILSYNSDILQQRCGLRLKNIVVKEPTADCLHQSWQTTASQDPILPPSTPLRTDISLAMWLGTVMVRWSLSQKYVKQKSDVTDQKVLNCDKRNACPVEKLLHSSKKKKKQWLLCFTHKTEARKLLASERQTTCRIKTVPLELWLTQYFYSS